jgi:hypothetical protein
MHHREFPRQLRSIHRAAAIYSDTKKTPVFETGPCDLAGAGFETGVTERPLSMGAHGNSQYSWTEGDICCLTTKLL